tara:strand:- start:501 stop:1103 length:603 start_codon:yes stop_codon:yes gene_type:complete
MGDALEKTGRHYKRMAVAAEYLSGRVMEEWYREVGITSGIGCDLLSEARKVHLLSDPVDHGSAPEQLSQAMPTQGAVREYHKAPPEVKEIIVEKIIADPDIEIKEAEIRKLRKENDDLIRRVSATETNNIRETVIDSSIIASSTGLLSDLASGMVDEYFNERLQPAQQERLLQTLKDIVNYSQSFIERNSIKNVTPIIDV